MRHHFVEATLRGFSRAMSKAFVSEQIASRAGLMQCFDPRARIVAIFSLVLAVTLCGRIPAVAGLFAVAMAIALASRVGFGTLVKRVWLVVFGFTGLIALPALFLTPGEPLLTLGHATITAQGARTAGLLILRVETAVTLTTALVLSTHWTHVLRALRSLGVPAEIVAMLAMTHRYIFLLMETANQMFESRQSRMVGVLSGREQRTMAARTAGVLLSKSMDMSESVYHAMQSRGFRGDIRTISEFRMKTSDFVAIAAAFCAGSLAVWLGR